MVHRLNPPYCEIFKIRYTDLQFQNPGYGWQKNKKNKKKNTGNCKEFCVWRKRKKSTIGGSYMNI